MRILAIAGSPRRAGNTDALLDQAIKGAVAMGAKVDRIVLSQLNFAPCAGCNRCLKTGRCGVQDDYQSLYDETLASDGIILASPVFFTNVTGHTKAFIDRFQCLWALKYVLRLPVPPPPSNHRRRAIFLSTAGSPKAKFDCTLSTVRAFLNTIDAGLIGTLCINDIDEKGAVEKHPEVLERAYALGAELASAPETRAP